jgi:hypothetical protein
MSDPDPMNEPTRKDPIWDFVREQMAREGAPEKSMRRSRRPSPVKITALAVVLLVVGASVVIGLNRSSMRVWPAQGTRVAGQDEIVAQRGAVAGVALVEGKAYLVREGARTPLAVGEELGPGDVVETSTHGAAGMEYFAGPVVVVEGDARIGIQANTEEGVRVGLVRGVLAASVPGGRGTGLRVVAENAEVRVTGTVFTARAERGRITEAAVASGTVEITSRATGKVTRVARSERLDVRTWTLEAGTPDEEALAHLARIAAISTGPAVQEPPDHDVADAPAVQDRGPTIAERIREALDAGDVEEALRLVEEHGTGSGGPAFLMAAAETYRRAGRWQEAADLFLRAAEDSKGRNAEKALVRAAEIHLRKLGQPARAAEIAEGYIERFPVGHHLDDALYFGGIAHLKSGQPAKGRSLLERYLEVFPSGAQATKVHLALAKILVVNMNDCAAAAAHIDAVRTRAAGTPLADQAGKLAARCAKEQP